MSIQQLNFQHNCSQDKENDNKFIANKITFNTLVDEVDEIRCDTLEFIKTSASPINNNPPNIQPTSDIVVDKAQCNVRYEEIFDVSKSLIHEAGFVSDGEIPPNNTTKSNSIRTVRRTVSECSQEVRPARGILKWPRDSTRRTLSESCDNCNSSSYGEALDDEFFDSCDVLHDLFWEGGDELNRCVRFNDRVSKTTFRKNASILGRKAKNARRTARRNLKSNSSSNISVAQSSAIVKQMINGTSDTGIKNSNINNANNETLEQNDLKSVEKTVIKDLLDEQAVNNALRTRQDSGYDSEETPKQNDDFILDDENGEWLQVKPKKNRKNHQVQKLKLQTALPGDIQTPSLEIAEIIN